MKKIIYQVYTKLVAVVSVGAASCVGTVPAHAFRKGEQNAANATLCL